MTKKIECREETGLSIARLSVFYCLLSGMIIMFTTNFDLKILVYAGLIPSLLIASIGCGIYQYYSNKKMEPRINE